MKAIRVEQFGGPEVLKVAEIPDLQPGPGQILVRLHAVGVNPVETYIRSGKYARLPALPYTPGSDGAGRIEALGKDAAPLQVGARVYVAGSLTGTYAELCLCEPAQVYPLPADTGFSEGAALGIPYATAHHALFARAGARRGETVLIHGGTGGVGAASIQFAKAAGLIVFATGGTDAGRLSLREQGVDHVFDHHEVGYLDRIREATGGRGLDIILEMLANINLGHDLTLLAPNGRIAVIGSRGPVEINPRDAMAREADILGVMFNHRRPEELATIHRAIADGLQNGALRPIVGRQLPLDRAPEAHEAVMSPGAHGKIVLLT
jgi:NADPH2:quinone reductase